MPPKGSGNLLREEGTEEKGYNPVHDLIVAQ
jgi:hypothetical protein